MTQHARAVPHISAFPLTKQRTTYEHVVNPPKCRDGTRLLTNGQPLPRDVHSFDVHLKMYCKGPQWNVSDCHTQCNMQWYAMIMIEWHLMSKLFSIFECFALDTLGDHTSHIHLRKWTSLMRALYLRSTPPWASRSLALWFLGCLGCTLWGATLWPLPYRCSAAGNMMHLNLFLGWFLLFTAKHFYSCYSYGWDSDGLMYLWIDVLIDSLYKFWCSCRDANVRPAFRAFHLLKAGSDALLTLNLFLFIMANNCATLSGWRFAGCQGFSGFRGSDWLHLSWILTKAL